MIDIHAHILPGIDDGAPDMDSALEMAALAVESGVSIMAATPHCSDFARQRNLWDMDLYNRVCQLRTALRRAGIPLRIYAGMEIFGSPQVPSLLRQGHMIGLAGSGYPLIEFPFTNYAAHATELLQEVVCLGMRPVVAHPERYLYIQQDPSILNLWVETGCLLQVNRGSLLGRFGHREQDLALELVERGFVCTVASDAHSPMTRTPWMRDVETLLREEFSPAAAVRLLHDNPLKLLNNEKIRQDDPRWFR